MTKIEDRDELIDRLIANKFSFSYNKDDNTICLTQGERRETTDNAIGYQYVGYVDERLFNIGDDLLECIVADAFVKYTELVADYVESKTSNIADKMFRNIVGF